MSAYTTINITRAKAMELILERLAHASDYQLARWADDILYERLFNCRVVNNTDENDDDRL